MAPPLSPHDARFAVATPRQHNAAHVHKRMCEQTPPQTDNTLRSQKPAYLREILFSPRVLKGLDTIMILVSLGCTVREARDGRAWNFAPMWLVCPSMFLSPTNFAAAPIEICLLDIVPDVERSCDPEMDGQATLQATEIAACAVLSIRIVDVQHFAAYNWPTDRSSTFCFQYWQDPTPIAAATVEM